MLSEIISSIILLFAIFSLIMKPFQSHSFTLKAIEKMYQLRTSNPLFMPTLTKNDELKIMYEKGGDLEDQFTDIREARAQSGRGRAY